MPHKIGFLPDDIHTELEEGEDILSALTKLGVKIKASCGGAGSCGSCKLILEKGEIGEAGGEKLSRKERDQGYFLSCKATPMSDLVVRIPIESRQNDLIDLALAQGEPGDLLEVLNGLEGEMPVRKVFLKLAKADLSDNLADLARIKRGLKVELATEKEIVAGLPLIRSLGKPLRAADFQVTVTFIEEEERIEVIRVEPLDTTKSHLAVAVDVGTTTIGASLIDLDAKIQLASVSSYNAQASFGDDVISRIVFAAKPGGLDKLKGAVIKTILELMIRLLEKSGRKSNEISALFMAGNTIMTHLLLGVDPKYIREEPYIPTAVDFPWILGSEIELDEFESVPIFMIPSVASYVGGDIVSGVVASKISLGEKLTLFIDVGTNGEIVLGGKDWLMACSCSAGPAFEGGGVKDGMKASKGAIEKVVIEEGSLKAEFSVMGDAKPVGICGSGLIDLLGELFLKKVVDQRGKIDPSLKGERVREGEGGLEYVVAFLDETASGRDIVISEADIDNLLRAKAAVFAGVKILLESMSLSPEAIDEILIAGSFGRYLDVEKIKVIGMLFETDPSKVRYVGNASLTGASLASLSTGVIKEARKVAQRMTYLELSADHGFMDAYISALFLPHTDVELFPSVMKRFKAGGG